MLVVDDSRFYRNRVAEMISSDSGFQVVDVADNGKDAITKALSLKPDVITMDVEMPIMDGITAVKEIMKVRPTPILMLSSLTHEGAKATLDALDAGALDYFTKRFDDIARDKDAIARELCSRLKILAKKRFSSVSRIQKSQSGIENQEKINDNKDKYGFKSKKLLLIGASTGGPSALQGILSSLPMDFSIPIVVVQHMPAAFTGPFAARLNSLCKVRVSEAKQGDDLMPGHVLIAPGGKQIEFESIFDKYKVSIQSGNQDEQYKPSVDICFNSAAKIFNKNILAIVLTGMGCDGKVGSAHLKEKGSSVWAQDESSCVVYGMPQAVVEAGLADRVLSLSEIAATLARGN